MTRIVAAVHVRGPDSCASRPLLPWAQSKTSCRHGLESVSFRLMDSAHRLQSLEASPMPGTIVAKGISPFNFAADAGDMLFAIRNCPVHFARFISHALYYLSRRTTSATSIWSVTA